MTDLKNADQFNDVMEAKTGMATAPSGYVLHQRIENDFRFHPANTVSGHAHNSVRELLALAAHKLADIVPEGRELSLALTNLEQAMMWANAGIARST